MSNHGAVACGHPATAAAVEEILSDGGNAFDAVLAGLAASCVAEPIFSSLAGGGFLLARPADGSATVYDFFVDTPGRRRPAEETSFYPIHADFGTATQEFHIGLGSAATPGQIKGLFRVHKDLGSVPLKRILEPAIRLAREGVVLRPVDAYLIEVVSPILVAEAEARALYTKDDGALITTGDRQRQPNLADSFEALLREGEDLLYGGGDLGRLLLEGCADQGGHLTQEDLSGYDVKCRQPIARRYRDAEILTNPPPSAGGILIGFALELLSSMEAETQDEGARLTSLGRVMALTNRARMQTALDQNLNVEGEAARRLYAPDLLARYRAEVAAAPRADRGTTHISVVDAEGNVAAMSLSNGEGCGHILPGTGVMLNNMLGEEDLNPGGMSGWQEGCRMSSMMAPTVATRGDGSLIGLGSGGSNRIRTAILQVLINLIDRGLPLREAVEAPRLHVEGGVANLEGGLEAPDVAGMGDLVTRALNWPEHNLFFGGVHSVHRAANGALSAAGDPRRGGAARVL
ncbi:gamma-glutamyltransferase [Pelagibius sp. Alg239-R121]|uniref:gamma-glutamyltransferase n=1 Tax=Pelagibius sp. Alg239-R121 TaxID=2993448 RepID=UPI0024A72FA4|nr:gamma-glutamyltransferase [Pelagibius sp. Alg239-R121]